MEKYITSQDGGDGFGSQVLSRIAGISYANYHNLNYIDYPISTILLEDNPESRNNELKDANNLLTGIMLNLGIKSISEIDNSSELVAYDRLYFYHQIFSNPQDYFNEKLLKKFQNSYSKEPPNYYQNGKLNIAIHIRRGDDISTEDPHRYISSDLYDRIIEVLLGKFKGAIIHIFSWNDPKINVKSERIIYHIASDGGEEFISDFNALVHADILLIGSSTFSLSAGFFNKNAVLCSKKIFKIYEYAPHAPIWEKNFENIIGEF